MRSDFPLLRKAATTCPTRLASAKYSHLVCAKQTQRSDNLKWIPVNQRNWRPRDSVSNRTPLGNQCPQVVHATLALSPTQTGRLVVVGDVHGCVLELAQLLKKVQFNRTRDKLVFVGDLCNKGPRSQQAVQLAMALDATVVRGNHDDAALASYYEHQRHAASIKVGVLSIMHTTLVRQIHAGLWALKSQGLVSGAFTPMKSNPKSQWVVGLSPREAAFMAQMPFTVEVPGLNVMIAHAGLVPGVAPKRQRLQDVYRMRVLYPVKGLRKQGNSANLDTALVESEAIDALDNEQEDAQEQDFAEEEDVLVSDTADPNGASDDEEEPAASNNSTRPMPWASQWAGPGHVIFGHDARRGLQKFDYATGLDTGCVYGRQLTACVLPLLPPGMSVKSVRHRTPTLSELQAELVSVPAQHKYTTARGDNFPARS